MGERTYHIKKCVVCQQDFQPTGPRHATCDVCAAAKRVEGAAGGRKANRTCNKCGAGRRDAKIHMGCDGNFGEAPVEVVSEAPVEVASEAPVEVVSEAPVEVAPRFEMSIASQVMLAQSIELYHKIFSEIKLDGKALEELVVGALRSDSTHGVVAWTPNSHSPGADIACTRNNATTQISVKSGVLGVDYTNETGMEFLTISGSRLTKYVTANDYGHSAIQKLNDYLAQGQQDITMAMTYGKVAVNGTVRHAYTPFYISNNLLTISNLDRWNPFFGSRGKNAGTVTGLSITLANAIEMKIHFNMSSQLWLKIPTSICTRGERIIA